MRTVRLRLTLLYGALFLVSGAALLALTYVLVRESTGPVVVRATHTRAPTVERLEPGSEPPLPRELGEVGREMRERAEQQRAETLEQLLVQSGIALALMAVLSVGLGWLMAGRVLRPPKLMLERLEAAYDAQRRFVANASHELRTPLAMMRTSLDVASAKPGGGDLRALDGKLREGLDRADRLLEGFLALARAEHGALADAETRVSLPDLTTAALDQRAGAIAERGLDVRRRLHDADARGSHALLARMVENVVDNAVRHNEQGGWIGVETSSENGVAQVVVESGGARLREQDVRELAQPFRRLGAERTGSENGVGLGLSIVAAIASAHGGKLELHARDQGGLRVQIELPAGGPA